MSVSADLVTAV